MCSHYRTEINDKGGRVCSSCGHILSDVPAVDDSCGCVFCDMDLTPKPYVVDGVNMGNIHQTKIGYCVPCTRQN